MLYCASRSLRDNHFSTNDAADLVTALHALNGLTSLDLASNVYSLEPIATLHPSLGPKKDVGCRVVLGLRGVRSQSTYTPPFPEIILPTCTPETKMPDAPPPRSEVCCTGLGSLWQFARSIIV